MSQIYGIDFTTAASQNPLSDSGNWVVSPSSPSNPLQIASNVCEGTLFNGGGVGNASGGSALSGPTLPADQYAQYQIGTLTLVGTDGFDNTIVLAIRASSTTQFVNGMATATIRKNGAWFISVRGGGSTSGSGATFAANDIITFVAAGTNFTLYQNGTILGTLSDPTVSSATAQVLNIAITSTSQTTILNYQAGSGNPFVVSHSISGNAGIAAATVSYTGPSSGSVSADGSGNYTIPALADGSYTVTPSIAG
jgi:hypothetical protein